MAFIKQFTSETATWWFSHQRDGVPKDADFPIHFMWGYLTALDMGLSHQSQGFPQDYHHHSLGYLICYSFSVGQFICSNRSPLVSEVGLQAGFLGFMDVYGRYYPIYSNQCSIYLDRPKKQLVAGRHHYIQLYPLQYIGTVDATTAAFLHSQSDRLGISSNIKGVTSNICLFFSIDTIWLCLT